MGWGNPVVLACLIGGALALLAFVFVEQHVPEPTFRLELFKIRMFSAGNIAGFLSALARGGPNLIIIIWLQGIWLAVIAALASLLRGKRYIYEQESQPQFDPPEPSSPASWKENKGKEATSTPSPFKGSSPGV